MLEESQYIILQRHSDLKKWYWHKTILKDQLTRTEDPEINPCSLILDKVSKIYFGEKTPFLIMMLGKPNIHMEKTETKFLFLTLHQNHLDLAQKS
jgi:hypothetical protein